MKHRLFLSIFPILALFSNLARAEEPSKTSASEHEPTSKPPKLVSSFNVPYPEGQSTEASVILELTIGADGVVSDGKVIQGLEPFASKARESSLTWTFEPAKRKDLSTQTWKSAAARIRFQVDFIPPKPISKGQTNSSNPSPKEEGSSTISQSIESINPFEIIVQGQKSPKPPVGISMSRTEIRQLPGAFGDAFRAVDVLPGMTPIASGIPIFYSRGAPPGNTGYFLDGIRVPLLYHIGIGPSVIHPAFIEKLDVYQGGYPAEYGRYTGAILAGTTKPIADELHGEASARLFDSGAFVETPITDKLSVAVGGRYSYTGAIISLLAKNAIVGYWDYQAKVKYSISDKDSLQLFAFGSRDYIGEYDEATDQKQYRLKMGFHRLDLRYEHSFSPNTSFQAATTLGQDSVFFGNDSDGALQNQGDLKNVQPRISLSSQISKNTHLVTGADFLLEDTSSQNNFEKIEMIDDDRTDTTFGGFVEATIKLSPDVELSPGIRSDYFKTGKMWAVSFDPRLAMKWTIHPKVKWIVAHGITHQKASFLPLPGMASLNLRRGLQESLQSSATVEATLPKGFSGSISGFHNSFLNMSDYLGTTKTGTENPDSADARTNGSAWGMEFLLKRRFSESISGLCSYTLSRTVRNYPTSTLPSAFDRTHVINAALSFDLGRKWRLGTRGTFYTGVPIEYKQNNPENATSYEIERSNPYFRLDARIEKQWKVGQTGWISFIGEVYNMVVMEEYVGGNDSTGIIIPSLGVEGGF